MLKCLLKRQGDTKSLDEPDGTGKDLASELVRVREVAGVRMEKCQKLQQSALEPPAEAASQMYVCSQLGFNCFSGFIILCCRKYSYRTGHRNGP